MGAAGSDLMRPLWLLGGEGKGAGGEERPPQLALPEINQKMCLRNTKRKGSKIFLDILSCKKKKKNSKIWQLLCYRLSSRHSGLGSPGQLGFQDFFSPKEQMNLAGFGQYGQV